MYSKKIRNLAVLVTILIGLMPLVMLHATPQEGTLDQSKNKEEKVLAVSTDQAGLYCISMVMDTISQVIVESSLGPENKVKHRVLSAADWGLDKETGHIRIKAPLKAGEESVYVYGTRAVPWAWRFIWKLDRNRVEMTLDGRAGVLGDDFEVDEKKCVLRLLKEELCRPDLKVDMSLGFKNDPGQQNMSIGFALSGSKDQEKPKRPEPEKRKRTKVNGVALPTEDPMVYTLSRPLESEDFSMAVAKKASFSFKNLKRDESYTFNEEKQTIHLLKEISLDPNKEYLVIHGFPPEPVYVIEFNEPLVPGTIHFYLNGAYLEEGKGFLVDYIDGKIAVLDHAWKLKDRKYSILAGNNCMSNCSVPPPPKIKVRKMD